MPKFPINAVDIEDAAQSVLRHLKLISRDANAALSLNNADVIRLYSVIYRAGAEFNSLSDKGYTAPVLGPVIGGRLSIDWGIYEQNFLDLKNVHSPAFMGAVMSNDREICQHHLVQDSEQYVSISDATKDVLRPLIQTIADLFEFE